MPTSALAPLVALALVAAACSSAPSEAPPPESRPTPATPDPSTSTGAPNPAPTSDAGRPQALVFLRRGNLVRLDLGSGKEEVVGRVGGDLYAVPGRTDRFLLVEDLGGGEDFATNPVLSTIDDRGRELASFGSGVAPLVDPGGTRVAFLRPAGDRACEGESCSGAAAVLLGELDGEAVEVLPPGDWHLLAWSGDELLVASGDSVSAVDITGTVRDLPLRPTEVWGASPGGEFLVLQQQEGVVFVGPSGRLRTEVRGVIAEGAWDPARERLLAVVVERGRARLAAISSADGRVAVIPDSQGAVGPILVAGDGSFAYVRADGLRLEAILCRPTGRCRSILSWAEGVIPLVLE